MKTLIRILTLLPLIVSMLLGPVGASQAATRVQPQYLGISDSFGRWPDATVNYVYNPTNKPAIFSDDAYTLSLIQQAMAEWENVSGIHFVYQGTDSNAVIDDDTDGIVVFGWADIGSAGLGGYNSSCTSLDITAAGYCPYTDGSVKLNYTTVDWDKGDAEFTASYFKQVVTHEIGHMIGLGHSDNPDSVMFANPYNHLHHPRTDDIEIVQALYGLPASLVPAGPYVLPPAGTSVLDNSYLIMDNDTATPISQLAAGDWVNIYLQFPGGFSKTAKLIVTDHLGYYYSGSAQDLNCDSKYAYCTLVISVAQVAVLQDLPGTWHAYVVIDGQTVATHDLVVDTSPVWNQAPAASLGVDAAVGKAPMTVTATVSAIDDLENDNVSLVWHVPTQGESTDAAVEGMSYDRTVTFTEPGTYTLFVEVNDDATRYGAPGSGSEAGAGFRRLLSIPVTVTNPFVTTNLDVDGNGVADALTDGLLVLRYLFGFRGDTLINGVIATDATRTSSAEIEAFLLQSTAEILDIDADGSTDALTDGLLVLRYLFGFRGATLINGVLSPNATRTSSAEIEAFLALHSP